MDATHIHLIINHLPILVTPIALLILIWGLIRDIKAYRSLSMWGFILAGITAYIAFESGEGAEDTIEQLAGISEQFIHDHEELAEWSLWASLALGLLAVGGLFMDRMKEVGRQLLVGAIIVLSLLSSISMAYTAYLGGQIRHSEIRPQQSQFIQPAIETDDKEQHELNLQSSGSSNHL